MENKIYDFRSDTVTLPTDAMFKAMVQAPLGDDVYGDDATVNRLEEMVAALMGKEAALFVPTGTMGNLISVMTHTQPGQEVILEESCHIYVYEVAGIARLAGVQAKPITGINGALPVEAVERAIRTKNIHFPETGLLCLENSHNMAGGTVIPLERMAELKALAEKHKIPVHLDGARIFNAALYLGVTPKEIAQYADSVMFCFSKGLSAPVGSAIVGTRDFIEKARKIRKMLGGGMRQVGVLAAAAISALEEHHQWLPLDHENGRLLATELNQIPGIYVDEATIHTNIINADVSGTGVQASELLNRMKERGIWANLRNDRVIRFVTHRGISRNDVLEAVAILKEIVTE